MSEDWACIFKLDWFSWVSRWVNTKEWTWEEGATAQCANALLFTVDYQVYAGQLFFWKDEHVVCLEGAADMNIKDLETWNRKGILELILE